MQFKIKKEELSKGIQTVQNAISQKNTLPILSNVLIETTEENKIKLTATDLDIGITSWVEAEIIEQGAITIPAKKLSDIIKELPNIEQVDVIVKKNNMMYIDCGTSHCKMIGLPKEDFPEIPTVKKYEKLQMSQKAFKENLLLTTFAVSKDESRYVLNGVLFIIDQTKTEIVATDGRRLALAINNTPSAVEEEYKAIIPVKALNELSKMLSDKEEDTLDIIISETQVFFNLKTTHIVTRLIDGDFPNYKNVIPKKSEKKAIITRRDLIAATKRASLFTNPDSLAVKFEVEKNKIIISKNAPYIGEVKEEVNCEYNGDNISIGFNPAYIIDILKVLEEEMVEIEFNDSDKPAVIRKEKEYVYVVLPMQIL